MGLDATPLRAPAETLPNPWTPRRWWCHTSPVSSPKPPLVLLHGVTGSGRIWQDVVPLLSGQHDVHTPTLPGHRGGPAIQRRPATIGELVDAVEHYLDEHGLAKPHLAGNSLGGWVSIELARRGRAASVCALSPAGFWWDAKSHDRVAGHINRTRTLARILRPATPLALRSAIGRRLGLRDVACHGERLTAARVQEIADIADDSTFMDDYTPHEQVAPLDPLPCPITLAWSQFDRLVPAETYGRTARERLPGATWVLLPGVGHIPMIDDPELVARTILAVTGAVA